MTISKKISLLDTNILVYAADTSSPFYSACKAIREKGIKGEIPLCVSPQVLFEFFAVITSPKRVTNPIKPKEAIEEVKKYLTAERIIKIYPKKDVLKKVMDLFEKYEAKRQEIFDLQLVATMLFNNVGKIYTYNPDHFSKFKEIEVLTP